MSSRNQKLDALALANQRRTVGAAYKNAVNTGQINLIEAIWNCTESMPAVKLLRSARGVGVQKAARVLVIAKVPAQTRMRDLTITQRDRIVNALKIACPTLTSR